MTVVGCLADTHVGAGADHRQDALADQEAVLDQTIEVFRDRRVELCVIAGDVFHKSLKALRDPESALAMFGRFTRNLERLGVPTVAITGNANHDIRNADLPCALDHFASDWFRVSRTPELIRAAGDVAVVTLPNVPVSRLVAMRGGGDRDEINDYAAALLIEIAAELRAQVPAGWPSLLLAHWSIAGASLPNGLPAAAVTEPLLPLDSIISLGFDAAIFGHLHIYQVLSEQPFVAYPGSPMVMDFGESHYDHGALILDLADARELVAT